MWVSPFRDLRINGYVLLPEAYRSLSRLSSALSAKASTLRSYSLDQPCIALHDRQVFTCFSFSMDDFHRPWPRMSFLCKYSYLLRINVCMQFSRYMFHPGLSALLAKRLFNKHGCLLNKSGSHLLSHAVSSIVPSAARVLTIVFGMGTGVSPGRIATGHS